MPLFVSVGTTPQQLVSKWDTNHFVCIDVDSFEVLTSINELVVDHQKVAAYRLFMTHKDFLLKIPHYSASALLARISAGPIFTLAPNLLSP